MRDRLKSMDVLIWDEASMSRSKDFRVGERFTPQCGWGWTESSMFLRGKASYICDMPFLHQSWFLYLRSRYICYRKRDMTVPYVNTHSHSATGLYNLSQSAIILHCVHHLTCKRAWFGLVLFRCLYCVCHFGFKNMLILSWIGCLVFSLFYLRNYSEVICQHGNLSSSGM